MFQLFKTFVAVYESRNFTHAAELLYLSQPTVSAQIKKLEDQLSVPLFSRNGKQEVIPTDEAVFLYPRVLRILEEWEDAANRVMLHDSFRERCNLACSHTCAIHFLPKLLPHLVALFPEVDFNLFMMNSEEAVIQMEQNKIDLSFVEIATRNDFLHQATIYQDELVLAGEPTATHWLLREADSGLHFFNELYLKKHNLTPRIININNNEVIMALLRQGFGQAIVSKLAVDDRLPWQPLTEENHRNFYLLRHKHVFRQKNNEIAAKITQLAERFQQL